MDEAPDYLLWGLRRIDNGDFEVDVLPAEKFSAPSPSQGFLDALGSRVQLSEAIKSADLQEYRSRYFSDPDADDWQDVWQLGWLLRFQATVDRRLPHWRHETLGLHAFDPENLDASPEPPFLCLVGADFQSANDADAARAAILSSEARCTACRSLGAEEPVFHRFQIMPGLFHERISIGTFGAAFFEDGAPYATLIEELCENAGGITNMIERCEEFGEAFDEDGLV